MKHFCQHIWYAKETLNWFVYDTAYLKVDTMYRAHIKTNSIATMPTCLHLWRFMFDSSNWLLSHFVFPCAFSSKLKLWTSCPDSFLIIWFYFRETINSSRSSSVHGIILYRKTNFCTGKKFPLSHKKKSFPNLRVDTWTGLLQRKTLKGVLSRWFFAPQAVK